MVLSTRVVATALRCARNCSRSFSHESNVRKMAICHPPKAGEHTQSSPELQELFAWALAQGVRWERLLYPVRFAPGYDGVQTTAAISPNDTIISVPKKLVIAARDVVASELKPVLEEHPELFQRGKHSWWEDFKLVLFLLFEDAKGPLSHWYVYLRTLPRAVDSTVIWTDTELAELQDHSLIEESRERLDRLRHLWTELRTVALQYPMLFTQEMITFEKFLWAQFIVTSRAFGKSVPSTSLCPIAELVNHKRSQTYYIYGSAERLKAKELADTDEDDWPLSLRTPCYTALANILKSVRAPLGKQADSYLALAAWDLDAKIDAEEGKRQWRPERFIEAENDVLRIVCGPEESYAPGSEVCLNYGPRSNRSLLIYYGFALDDDQLRYDFVYVRPGNYYSAEEMEKAVHAGCKETWAFKIRETAACDLLLATLRTLLWRPTVNPLESAIRSGDDALELRVLEEAQRVIENRLAEYPTTMQQDQELLKTPLPLRAYFAVQYRRQRKAALYGQLELLREMQRKLQP